MRKYVKTFLLICALTVGLFDMTALAAEPGNASDISNDFVSIDKYETGMKQIYAKYGIDWKIVDASEAVPITEELYYSELERAEKEGMNYQSDLNKAKKEALILDMNRHYSTIIGDLKDNTKDISLHGLMPVTGDYTYLVTFNTTFGSCTVRAKTTGVYNADYGQFISVSNTSFRKWNGINCTGWENQGSYVQCNNNTILLCINGISTYEYIIPGVNVKVEDSMDAYGVVYWYFSDMNKTKEASFF